jgi:hypothetical protein
MSRDEKIVRRCADGTLAVFCPACKCAHGVNSGWTFNGDMERPTFSPSILVTWEGFEDGKEIKKICHSYVRDGQIQFLNDCTHELAGKTVPLEAF